MLILDHRQKAFSNNGELGLGRLRYWHECRGGAVPDLAGHFGPYGGVFVPETLIAALDQLQREYAAIKADPEFQREIPPLHARYVGGVAVLFCQASDRTMGRGEDLSQARRSQPHRRPQDQQLHWQAAR